MRDLFKDFGTSLYLRRGMQKRAFYGKRAVDYLEKVGVFDPSQQQDPQQTPRQAQPQGGLTMPEAAAMGLGTAAAGVGAMGALNALGRKAAANSISRATRNYKDAFGRALVSRGTMTPENMSGSARDLYRKTREALRANGTEGLRNRIVSRNCKITGMLGKARKPMLLAGALGGSLLASKHIYDRVKGETRQARQMERE